MKTKNIFKAMAMAMLMPAMLLTTACSNDDIAVNNNDNNNQKGYPLQVTINVTRQGDDAANSPTNRVSYNGTTRRLEFTSGDQLFVKGTHATAGQFAGTLDYVPASSGNFSGTIYTENTYSGTADALFTTASSKSALLLPAGYEDYHFLSISGSGYSADVSRDATKAFVTSTTEKTAKAIAVEQFSYERATSYVGGFGLFPYFAVLNFTITGLTASTNVTATLKQGTTTLVSGLVTTDGSGNATFAMGLLYGYNLIDLTLTVGGNNITITTSSNGQLPAGHIFNITRSVPAPSTGALPGKFTINGSGNKVMFSQGNLQASYISSAWSWGFALNQWTFVGNSSSNTNITGNGTVNTGGAGAPVDLFGWSTASTSYGINKSEVGNYYSGDFVDWGNLAITNGGNTPNSGWRTLTNDEWKYIFSTRTTGGTIGETAQARYTHATIRTDATGVNGMILFPDGVNLAASEFSNLGTVNGVSDYATKCTSTQWTALANKGCVFLPAAGYRENTTVNNENIAGNYWSSSPSTDQVAYCAFFNNSSLDSRTISSRRYGQSVRLVRAVE